MIAPDTFAPILSRCLKHAGRYWAGILVLAGLMAAAVVAGMT